MFEIRKDIAIPVVKSLSRGRPSKYPFAIMEIGDMFFVPKAKKSFRVVVNAAERRLGRKFSVRAMSEAGVDGIGCWRVN